MYDKAGSSCAYCWLPSLADPDQDVDSDGGVAGGSRLPPHGLSVRWYLGLAWIPAKGPLLCVPTIDDRRNGLWEHVEGLPSFSVTSTVCLEHRQGDAVKTVGGHL